MPDLTWLNVLIVLVISFVAGFGWTLGGSLASALWGAVRRGG